MNHRWHAAGRVFAITLIALLPAAVYSAAPAPSVELITDHSARSDACGPAAIRWGFMCPVVARHGDQLWALNFTRPAGVPWDQSAPNEMPIALWTKRGAEAWRSTVLDPPQRSDQTPTLLLGPDGRANVFTLNPLNDTIYWFHGDKPDGDAFRVDAIKMGWGSYLSGAIDEKGRALLVYWGSDPSKPGDRADYANSTIGYTLVDTTTGKSANGVIDARGMPYCYSFVVLNASGAHLLCVRSEVADTLIRGLRTHYTELRYYHCADPTPGASWTGTQVFGNDRACIQPQGLAVDASGRAQLLYIYTLDLPDGTTVPNELVYATAQAPPAAGVATTFEKHKIRSDGYDGRLFQTPDGQTHVVSYTTGHQFDHARIIDPQQGTLTAWETFDVPVTFNRIFPLDGRSGSTPPNKVEGADELEGLMIGAPGTPNESSVYLLHLATGR